MALPSGSWLIIPAPWTPVPGTAAASRDPVSADDLRPLFPGVSILVILVSTADTDPARRAMIARSLRRLQDLCDAEAVQLVAIGGGAGALLTKAPSLVIRDRSLVVVPRDAIEAGPPPAPEEFDALLRASRTALERRQTASILERLEDGPDGSAASAGREPATRAAMGIWAWRTLPARLAAAARAAAGEPAPRYIITDHPMRPGVWSTDSFTVLNIAPRPGCPRGCALVVHGARVEKRPIVQPTGSAVSLGNQPLWSAAGLAVSTTTASARAAG